MIKNLIKSIRPARDAVTDAVNFIDQIREQNAAKREEIRRIEEAVQPVDDAMSAFDRWAHHLATDAVEAVHPGVLLSRATASDGLRLPYFVDKVGDARVVNTARATQVLLGLLLATQPDAFRKLIADHLTDQTAGRETLTLAEQTRKRSRAKAELLELEVIEERAIRDLEAVGVSIARRATADPAAVLADDSSLRS